ncbi:MAG: GNAT family N-acetyltransferase [Bacteroidia bacterium]|nr:GNAT family N-acetyltransferase [Bacteroidia bacterium]
MYSRKFKISDYVNGDFEEINALWESTGVNGAHRGDDAGVIDETIKTGGKLIVLRNINNEIIGTSWLTNDGRRIYLHHFCVRPDYQGKGLGKLLAAESLKFAKKQGKQIKLEVHKDNLTAIELYKKGGFKYLGDYLVFIKRDFMKTVLLFSFQFFLLYSVAQDFQQERLKSHITYLASDSLAGRKAGEPGDRLAADYIVEHFRKTGLKLLFENGYQYFDIISDVQLGKDNYLEIDTFIAKPGQDFIPYSFSENSELTAEAVFAGYGFDIKTDSIIWFDYDGLEVKDKWVIALRGDPEPDNPDSKFAEFSNERTKALVAKDKGAAGLLLVTGIKLNNDDELVNLFFDKITTGSGIPVINITRKVANIILKQHDSITIEQLEEKLNKEHKPCSFQLRTLINAKTEIIKTTKKTQNIIGIIQGADSVFKNEYIVLGAHYDHLGMGGKGSGSRNPDTLAVHNGADDNASGTAAIIEIAYKIAANKSKPNRSIIFAAFGAEEMGLLGSKHFVKNSPVKSSQIKAMFNFDMLGRMNSQTNALTIGGTGTFKQADSILNASAAGKSLKFVFSPEGYGPSDHATFYTENIPVLFLTTGPHEDYHTFNDDPEKVNYDGIEQIISFSGDLVSGIANMDKPLTFQEAGSKFRAEGRHSLKITLGIIPGFGEQDGNGLMVDGVKKGGRAEAGGIKKGDKIIAIDGKPVTNIYDYMYRLKKLSVGQTITVDIIRNGEKIVLIIQL